MSHRTKNRLPPRDPIGLPLIICLLFIFIGTVLAIILGPTFVFFHVDYYAEIDHYRSNMNIQGEDVALQLRQSSFGYRIGQMSFAHDGT